MSAGQLSLYGLTGEVLDNLDDVDDLARAMAELEGVHVQVTCKLARRQPATACGRTSSESRTGKSDVPVDQSAFSLGDGNGTPAPAPVADDDEIPF